MITIRNAPLLYNKTTKDMKPRIIRTIKRRWKARVPKFFKWVMGIGTSVAAVALAIQMALVSGGASVPAWWETIYPYLIGIGAGMTAVAKLTRDQQEPPPADKTIIDKEPR